MENGREGSILDIAAEMVNASETGVTLRQWFKQLVAAGSIPNIENIYRWRSNTSAKAHCKTYDLSYLELK